MNRRMRSLPSFSIACKIELVLNSRDSTSPGWPARHPKGIGGGSGRGKRTRKADVESSLIGRGGEARGVKGQQESRFQARSKKVKITPSESDRVRARQLFAGLDRPCHHRQQDGASSFFFLSFLMQNCVRQIDEGGPVKLRTAIIDDHRA
ncbi:hypothetical protein BO82DRAFT_123885 [Aspergillus uvarum CBS 121591]|uniref:Uncharacterized protein n=1 Tax=Aspergillus uvarum CBS 121591 TaxID=1448315 RepID=A0A319C7J0_9EURO|nr:hypothetical protein BO82DRAFT_123885 [Aspergillus uvarum CBS 121591]PYH79819.1 hypothetical protein BO82DRAFT_123885 [Aspergillus uvarum CBS 121591]